MAWWDSAWPIIAALLPSAGLGYLFYVVMKHVIEADRRERAAEREWDQRRDQQSAYGSTPPDGGPSGSDKTE